MTKISLKLEFQGASINAWSGTLYDPRGLEGLDCGSPCKQRRSKSLSQILDGYMGTCTIATPV